MPNPVEARPLKDEASAPSQPARRVPYVDLVALHRPLKERILEAMGRVFDHGQFVLGPEVAELESRLARRLDVPEVVAVNSGTDALMLALRLAGVKPEDEVITVSHSFVATASAVSLLGARPVYAEVDESTMSMDPSVLEGLLSRRTRAVMPVHLNGHPCPVDEIGAFCDAHGLALVEDCAQAFGARRDGRAVGTSGLGCFSLHPLKTLSVFGDGGFVAVAEPTHAEALREWRNLGLRDRDHCHTVSGNSRLDTIQAAGLLVKLEVVDDWIAARRRHAEIYRRELAGTGLRMPPGPTERDEPVFTAFVVRHSRRDQLRRGLADRGVDAKPHYPLAIHQQPAFSSRELSLPVTERVVGEILSLPCGPQLTDEDRDHVIGAVRETLQELGE